MGRMLWVDEIERINKSLPERYRACREPRQAKTLITALRLAEAELRNCLAFPDDTRPTMDGRPRSVEWWYDHIQRLQRIQHARVARVLARLRSGDVEDK